MVYFKMENWQKLLEMYEKNVKQNFAELCLLAYTGPNKHLLHQKKLI